MLKKLLFGLVGGLGLFASPVVCVVLGDEIAAVLYISPSGDDAAVGTAESPLRSVNDAAKRLAQSGGTIKLLKGVYREPVRLASSASTKRLVIEADGGAEVVFDGGRDLTDWQPMEGNLYSAEATETAGIVNLWDPEARFRFLKQIDEAGVKGWPGSFLNEGRIVIQTPNSKAPGTLRCNAEKIGFEIARSHTVIRGIRFKDYLGDKAAAAIAVRDAREVEIVGCIINNTVRGVSTEKSTRDLRVKDCLITDVGCGVYFSGVGLEVLDCVILAASRDFAIREELDYDELNGVRFYHPAEKGIVRGCVTAGFWTGLYQKTSVGPKGPLPFICEGNLFLDGLQSVTGAQKGNRYAGNLIFGGVLSLSRPEGQHAEVEENYVFHLGKSAPRNHGAGNRLGHHPFNDLARGDLSLSAGAVLPMAAQKAAERLAARFAAQGIVWTPEIAAALAYRFSPPEAPATLAFTSEPTCVSSLQGAIVTARLNAPAKGMLRFRMVGDKEWREVAGKENLLSSATALAAFENVTDVAESEGEPTFYAVAFPLLNGLLEPGKDYEYRLEFKSKEAATSGSLVTEPARFQTQGSPKEIRAQLGKGGLQTALDQALPGDTIVLEKGVYIYPALLSHGGTAEAPIVIRGAAEGGSILDGGRRYQAMLELRGARHVVLRDLQVRLFERAGIVVEEGAGITFERCFFMNKAIAHVGYTNGTGILLKSSPGTTIERCLFTRLLYGVQANDSPGLTLMHNTSFKNLFSSALLRQSSRGSRVMYNSFTFTGNISFYIIERDPEAFQSLVW